MRRFWIALSLSALIAASSAVVLVGGPLARSRADIERMQATALLPSQVREAEARAVIVEQSALERRASAAYWMAFWNRAQRWVGAAAFAGVMGGTLLALMALAAPVIYLWQLTLVRASLIWPDVRGNLPIASGNPLLLDAEKALTLATNAQIAAAIVASVRAQGDAATAQSLSQSISGALVGMADTLGARQARALARPDRRWVHPRAQADVVGDDNRDWAADMIQFVKRGSAAGFGRREWAGQTLPSGRACTPTVWAAMRDDLLKARIVRQDGRGKLELAVSVEEALERLELE